MAKSIPPTVKHALCNCKIVQGPFGPHGGKIICIEHNVFVQWIPKSFFEVTIVEEEKNL